MDKKESFLQKVGTQQLLICKIASLYTNSREDRDDLIQEIMLQLWKSYDSFREQSLFSTWLYRVSMNVAIYHLKLHKRSIKTVRIEEGVMDMPEANKDNLEERWIILKQQLDQLNLLEKGIVILYMENKSHEEIASIIGISVSNVGTRLYRIKEKLRERLNKNA